MIRIFPLSEMPKVIRKAYELEPDVFLKVRDFYKIKEGSLELELLTSSRIHHSTAPRFILVTTKLAMEL